MGTPYCRPAGGLNMYGIENMEMHIHVTNALIAINVYPVFNELSFVQGEYNYRYS